MKIYWVIWWKRLYIKISVKNGTDGMARQIFEFKSADGRNE